MEFFTGHKLIRETDGYVLILYVDWKEEFSGPPGDMGEEEDKNLKRQAQEYINRHLSNIRIKSIQIFAGSLLIASISLFPLKASAYADTGYPPSYDYTVRQGDTLYKIAIRYNTTVQEIKRINGLGGDIIYPGQALHVPRLVLPEGVYSIGSRGEEVRRIQEVLASFGYDIWVDGIYGEQTAGFILHFQQKYPELKADGIYGPRTKAFLEKLFYTPYRIVSQPDDRLVLVNKFNSLPHDYTPSDLVVPAIPFTFKEDLPQKLMRQEAAQALEELFKEAEQDHISLLAVSGYRSYERQAQIFAANVQRSPQANELSARPGESEHQTGLAMDVTSPSANYRLSRYFGDTPEGKWLKEHAPEFGFIIRYPKGKEPVTGYQYEPWHLRYVGQSAARQVTLQGLTLEEYLGPAPLP